MIDSEEYLYTENPDIGNEYREKQKDEFDRLIERMRSSTDEQRGVFFNPSTATIHTYEK